MKSDEILALFTKPREKLIKFVNQGVLEKAEKNLIKDVLENQPYKDKHEQYEISWGKLTTDYPDYSMMLLLVINKHSRLKGDIWEFMRSTLTVSSKSQEMLERIKKINQEIQAVDVSRMREGYRKSGHNKAHIRLDHKIWLTMFCIYTEIFAQYHHAYLKFAPDKSVKHQHLKTRKSDLSVKRQKFECWANDYLSQKASKVTGYFGRHIKEGTIYEPMRNRLVHTSLLPDDYFKRDIPKIYGELADLFIKTKIGMEASYNLMTEITGTMLGKVFVSLFFSDLVSAQKNTEKLEKLFDDVGKAFEK